MLLQGRLHCIPGAEIKKGWAFYKLYFVKAGRCLYHHRRHKDCSPELSTTAGTVPWACGGSIVCILMGEASPTYIGRHNPGDHPHLPTGAAQGNMHIMRGELSSFLGKLVPKIRTWAKLQTPRHCKGQTIVDEFILPLIEKCSSVWQRPAWVFMPRWGFAHCTRLKGLQNKHSRGHYCIHAVVRRELHCKEDLMLIRKLKDASGCENWEIFKACGGIAAPLSPLISAPFLQAPPGQPPTRWPSRSPHYSSPLEIFTIDYNKNGIFFKTYCWVNMFIMPVPEVHGRRCMKVSRIMIALRKTKREMASVIHPRSSKVLKYEVKAPWRTQYAAFP